MATLKKVDVTGDLFCGNVFDKPPLPGRPSSGKFHNRGSGKLFPTTQQNKLFIDDTTQNEKQEANINHMALVLHPDFKVTDDTSAPSTPKSVPSYCRRTQSAKARLVKKNTSQRSQRQRPVSAGCRLTKDKNGTCSSKPAVVDLANKVIPDLFEIEKQKILALPDPRDIGQNVYQNMLPMHFSRPSSAKYCDSNTDTYTSNKKVSKSNKSVKKGLQPSVYGLQRQRHFYGSAPDLSSTNCYFDQYPYKISETIEETNLDNDIKTSDIPCTLEPLLPWLQDDVPEDVIGVNPAECLVFLAPTDWSELPELPEPQAVDDDLPFVQDITTPKPWNPKKYPYYSSKQPVDDWVCKHNSHGTSDNEDSKTIYRPTFRIPRMRTADIVKKEITDLENLLKGVGNMDSNCSMVNYQSEIISFQNLLNDTLEMVPERLKNPPSESPKDTFGLHKMVAEHDIIIRNIEQRVNACRQELAVIEQEAGIDTARQHFRERSNSVL